MHICICAYKLSIVSITQLIYSTKIMELELELKLTRVADEFSSVDFLFAKDRSGPVFTSTERDRLLILKAHLKGYRKQDIKIEINEDGSRIIIRGEKKIQETVMVGLKLYRKETEIRRFRKAFKIPDGVILDKIKANFNEDDSILTISMPKKEKGIRGLSIEEVEEQELSGEGSENLQIVPEEFPKEENVLDDEHKDTEADDAGETGLGNERSSKMPEIASVDELKQSDSNVLHPEETQLAHDTIHTREEEKKENQPDQSERLQKVSDDHAHTDSIEETKTLTDEVEGASTAKSPIPDSHTATDGIPQVESGMHKQEISSDIQGKMEGGADQNPHTRTKQETNQNQHKYDEIQNKGENIQEEEEESSETPEEAQEGVPSSSEREKERSKLCTPILAGSALLLSLVVFVIHFIRSKSQPGKRKD